MKDYFGQAFKFRKGKPRAILDPATFDPDKALADEKAKEQRQLAKLPKAGGLAPGSILDAIPDPGPPKHEESPEKKKPAPVDPRPRSTARWQRKMVIRAIRSRGRITKEVKLARMERKHLSKSEFIKTSVKKLYPLARQIAGKPLAEAMVQMRFSRKKAAQDVLKHLEYARDQAIVTKGMGLGKVQARQIRERSRQQLAGGQEAGAVVKELEQPQQQQEEKLIVEDKKGKKRVVTDRTAMYVDEAWVGRGQYRRALEARARGQSNRLMLPYTSMSYQPIFLSFPPTNFYLIRSFFSLMHVWHGFD